MVASNSGTPRKVTGSIDLMPNRNPVSRRVMAMEQRIPAIENRWLPGALPTLKHSTKKHYQHILRVHVYPALGDMQLRLINRDVVQEFISSKLRSGLSWR